MEIIIMAAMTPQRIIGLKNTIPWDLPSEQKFFKFTTTGHTLLMGRKTYQSIGAPLSGRKNIVLTSQNLASHDNLVTANSIDQALSCCNPGEKIFVIGGATVYEQMLPFAQMLLLTTIHASFPGDTYFPHLPPDTFSVTGVVHVHDHIPYTIKELVRTSSSD